MWYSSSWRVWPIHRLSAECYVPPLLKYDQLWGEAQHWCEAAQHQEPVCFAEGRQNSAGVRCSGENLSGQGWVAKICLVLSIWKLHHFEKCTWRSSASHADPVIQLITKHREELSGCLSTYIAKWNQSQLLEQKQTLPISRMNRANSLIFFPLFPIRKLCSQINPLLKYLAACFCKHWLTDNSPTF